MLADTLNSELLEHWASNSAVSPRHPAANRIVTAHGDIHGGNIVRAPAYEHGAAFIDLELACVTRAVHDLGQVVGEIATTQQTTDEQAARNARVLLCVYLQHTGHPPPTDSDLDELLLDCRVSFHCSRFLCARNLPCTPDAAHAVISYVHEFAAAIREEGTLRDCVLQSAHCEGFFADTLGAKVHELGGLCMRAAQPSAC